MKEDGSGEGRGRNREIRGRNVDMRRQKCASKGKMEDTRLTIDGTPSAVPRASYKWVGEFRIE